MASARSGLLALLLLASPAWACTVVGIQDGDTLTALCEQKQIRVRLAEIDAPERKQPFGTRSRQSLADMCFQRRAKLNTVDVDRYGRTVARVYCDGMDANTEQVRRGMAWVYVRYSKDAALPAIEADARQRKRGLWADPSPVPPWEWRRSK